MMKIIITYLIFAFTNLFYCQQNLVPNGSFEDMVSCPTSSDGLNKATGWFPYMETPDYLNSCTPNTDISVPNNLWGNQYAASGNAYVQIRCYADFMFTREVAGGSLVAPLTIGQKYFVSFKVNRADILSDSSYSINKLGAKFSTVSFSPSNPVPINNFAHIFTNSIISDTANWVLIMGSFVADSAYNYIMIGNFFDDSNTTVVNNGSLYNCAYYFIDDVCVSTDSLLCANFSVSVKENSFKHQFSFYPNPTTDFVIVQNSFNTPFNLTVYNSLGQEIYRQQSITSNHLQLNVSNYNTGLLFIKITLQNNQFTYKLLKQ